MELLASIAYVIHIAAAKTFQDMPAIQPPLPSVVYHLNKYYDIPTFLLAVYIAIYLGASITFRTSIDEDRNRPRWLAMSSVGHRGRLVSSNTSYGHGLLIQSLTNMRYTRCMYAQSRETEENLQKSPVVKSLYNGAYPCQYMRWFQSSESNLVRPTSMSSRFWDSPRPDAYRPLSSTDCVQPVRPQAVPPVGSGLWR